MRCEQCGKRTQGRRFCTDRCKWTWHNHNRTLTPNTFYRCEVCSRKVAKYLTPSAQARQHVVNRFCSRTCAGRWRRGENHPMWRGGEPVDSDGYVYAMCPGHKQANARGYVFKHRLVMESHLGRLLRKSEVVHHKNGNRADNRIGNLTLYKSQASHMADEVATFPRRRNGTFKR